MPVFKDSLTKVVPNNDTDIWTPSWGIRMAHILKESANRDGGQGQSWCGRWQFRTKTAWWELFLMMILTSELHQVLTHLFHTRAAVDFEPVPACPLLGFRDCSWFWREGHHQQWKPRFSWLQSQQGSGQTRVSEGGRCSPNHSPLPSFWHINVLTANDPIHMLILQHTMQVLTLNITQHNLITAPVGYQWS